PEPAGAVVMPPQPRRADVTKVLVLTAAAFALLAAACSGGSSSDDSQVTSDTRAKETASQSSCTLSRRYMQANTDDPPKNVKLTLVGGNASAKPDDRGRWSIDVGTRTSVVVRVESNSMLRDIPGKRVGRRGSAAIPAGVAEVTYNLDQDCNSTVAAVKDVSPGGAHGRPKPPQLPGGFTPSAATLSAKPPAPGPGTAANVPWTGSFWTTAPVVTAGICDIDDAATKEAAEIALPRWQEAPNLGWQIERD